MLLQMVFPAWLTVLLILLSITVTAYICKRHFEGNIKAIKYLAKKLDEMNAHLVEQGFDPLDMSIKEDNIE